MTTATVHKAETATTSTVQEAAEVKAGSRVVTVVTGKVARVAGTVLKVGTRVATGKADTVMASSRATTPTGITMAAIRKTGTTSRSL